MRWGLWSVAALVLGAIAAQFLMQDRGYVLVNFRGYMVEMSVPGLLMALAALYGLLRLAGWLWRAPRSLGEQLAARRSRRASRRLSEAVMHIAEGRPARGERLLTGNLRRSDTPLVNYLLAARAAQQQGSVQRRDEWLRLACDTLPDAEVAILLTQAELQLANDDPEHALATLRRVEERDPVHPVALGLMAEALRAIGDSASLVDLLPRLAHARIAPDRLEELAADALAWYSRRADLTDDQFTRTWSGLPSGLRRAPRLLRLRAEALRRLGHADAAERELRSWLRRSWDAELVRAYGETIGADPREQLRRAEQWLGEHADDPVLLLTAARLCIANELWGKARSYLESSLAIAPRPEAYALYAHLLDQIGEAAGAANAYRSGLTMLTGTALPALGRDGDDRVSETGGRG